MVTTKSPLTGAITCSNSGGYFPAELKKTGHEAIIFEGKSPQPVYLWINGDSAELRSAAHLWGKTTHETDDALRVDVSPVSAEHVEALTFSIEGSDVVLRWEKLAVSFTVEADG